GRPVAAVAAGQGVELSVHVDGDPDQLTGQGGVGEGAALVPVEVGVDERVDLGVRLVGQRVVHLEVEVAAQGAHDGAPVGTEVVVPDEGTAVLARLPLRGEGDVDPAREVHGGVGVVVHVGPAQAERGAAA